MLKRLEVLTCKLTSHSFVPKSHDIELAEKIARMLEDEDKYKTLVNLMEWIDRNISFWHERAYLDLIARPILHVGVVLLTFIVMLPVLIFFSLIVILLLGLSLFYSFVVSLLITILLFWYFLFKMPPFGKLLLIAMGSTLFYNFSAKMLELQPKEAFIHYLNLSFIYWMIAGGSILALSYLTITYLPLTRYYENASKFLVIMHLINLTFKAELSVEDITRLRKGVCRDYAKLTASILVNLFPNDKIYFFLIPWHVAAGIEIGGKIYVLDQKLPIMSLEAWLNRWNTNCTRGILVLRNKDNLKLTPVNPRICRNISMRVNLGKELDELVEKTCQAVLCGKSEAVHVLKGYAKIFDVNDRVVIESLIRMIRVRVERELTSKASPIGDIAISKNEDDLIMRINVFNKK